MPKDEIIKACFLCWLISKTANKFGYEFTKIVKDEEETKTAD